MPTLARERWAFKPGHPLNDLLDTLHGEVGLNYDYATAMAEHLERVQTDLNTAVMLAESKADPEDFESIKKSLGMLIGKVDMELLWPIFKAYPELDVLGITGPPD